LAPAKRHMKSLTGIWAGEAMSLLKCDSCGALIDTDDHPEAYDEKQDAWLCKNCGNWGIWTMEEFEREMRP